MENAVYYFSGTGNTLHIARRMAEGLDADLVPVTEGLRTPPTEGLRRIGIVFPIYMYHPPRIVVDFIRALNSEAYVFTVATFGGSGGDVYSRLRRLFRSTGAKLSAAFGVRMPTNYTPFGEALPAEEQKEIFEKAADRVEDILTVVRARASFFEKDGGFFDTKIHPGLLYKMGYAMIPSLDKEFHAEGSCNECGICEKVCPVNNISMENGRPQWRHGCQQCFACFHWCPKEAIEYGTKTQGKRRYRHPEVRARDIMAQGEGTRGTRPSTPPASAVSIP